MIDRPLVVITDCDHHSTAIEEALFAAAGYELRLAQCRTEDDVVAAASGALGLLAQYAPITQQVIAALPSLRVIGRYGVGLDNIDLQAAARRQLAVVNVLDYCVDEVADHALALTLALTRGVAAFDRGVHHGVWDYTIAGELRRTAHLQLGIVGLGRIGTAVARRALALKFQVVAFDQHQRTIDGVQRVELDDLLENSDVVSLHLPLDPATHHFMSAERLCHMKRGAFLINTSRGGLVDQAALVGALQRGHLGAVALDVLEHEPVAPEDPLLQLPNVVLTPHAAFYSGESLIEMKRRVSELMVAALTTAQ